MKPRGSASPYIHHSGRCGGEGNKCKVSGGDRTTKLVSPEESGTVKKGMGTKANHYVGKAEPTGQYMKDVAKSPTVTYTGGMLKTLAHFLTSLARESTVIFNWGMFGCIFSDNMHCGSRSRQTAPDHKGSVLVSFLYLLRTEREGLSTYHWG